MHCAPASSGTTSHSLFRHQQEGLYQVRLKGPGLAETFLSLSSLPSESPAALFQRLYRYLGDNPELHVVRQDVFGVVPDASGAGPHAYRLSGRDWPATWVGHTSNGVSSPVAGIQIQALEGRRGETVFWRNRPVGTHFEDEHARYCVLAGLGPAVAGAPRRNQTREVLELMEECLQGAGFEFRDVIRTWFYLDDILDWYGDFNLERNQFFKARGVFDGIVPASTGVGGSNAAGTALVADLLAVRPKDNRSRCLAVPSPLQSSALDYGSSFSRAVELDLPGQRRLYVSGTASILPNGRTAHEGDVDAQVKLTMEVVEAILASREMTWNDVVRGIAYFKHLRDTPALRSWLAARGLVAWPVIISQNDICRDDLLFELEVDAVAVTPAG